MTYTPTTKPANAYDFPILAEVPDRPDKLFVPEQLESALRDLAPDGVEVDVNTRFTRTVARATYAGASPSSPVSKVEVSWEHFEDEEHWSGEGWLVVCSAFAAAAQIEFEN